MSDILVINLQERVIECAVCGTDTGSNKGVPVYEDFVLPNSWSGEWFGADVCDLCFVAQNSLAHPVRMSDLRRQDKCKSPQKK